MDYKVDDYRDIARRLKERLELETDMVAIRFIKDVSEIPEGFVRPLRDTGKKMTLCMAIGSARREGIKYAMTAYDNPCVINAAQGWTKTPLRTLVKSQVDNHWQKDFLSMLRVNTQRLRMGHALPPRCSRSKPRTLSSPSWAWATGPWGAQKNTKSP
jgi:hypothetical protein